jgi:hypothetical protein
MAAEACEGTAGKAAPGIPECGRLNMGRVGNFRVFRKVVELWHPRCERSSLWSYGQCLILKISVAFDHTSLKRMRRRQRQARESLKVFSVWLKIFSYYLLKVLYDLNPHDSFR